MSKEYGEIRAEDLVVLKQIIEVFRKANLSCGLHGTSLWNHKYKDVDLLVVSQGTSGVKEFLRTLEELQKKFKAKVTDHRGNETIGLDYDIKIGKMNLHLSYVILLENFIQE
jgi:hypothetical protein